MATNVGTFGAKDAARRPRAARTLPDMATTRNPHTDKSAHAIGAVDEYNNYYKAG